jgi:CRP-like cAMP-binding protein
MKPSAFEMETYYECILHFLQKFGGFSRDDLALITPHLQVRTFEKKQIILQLGEIENYLSMVMKGLVRKYILVDKKQVTIQLATEAHLIQSEFSFHMRVPSEMVIEAIEPTTMFSMQFEHVQDALREMPNAEEIARKILSYMFLIKDARVFSMLKYNTRERFLEYVNRHPHMLQRVPQKILASYLNIKPETFSRLKHLVLRKENN